MENKPPDDKIYLHELSNGWYQLIDSPHLFVAIRDNRIEYQCNNGERPGQFLGGKYWEWPTLPTNFIEAEKIVSKKRHYTDAWPIFMKVDLERMPYLSSAYRVEYYSRFCSEPTPTDDWEDLLVIEQ